MAIEPPVEDLLDSIEAVDADGWYPAVDVHRPWSAANPQITGEFARPDAIRPYLRRELSALLKAGATVTVRASRPALAFDDPGFFDALDEDRVDLRHKKLFLFGPERMALSLDRLSHYCGTPAEQFQRHVLFTNYAMHVEAFRERFPDAAGPSRPGVQMPAWHQRTPDGTGVSLVNIGVGPSNAKTITDHLAVLRPDTMVMIGHCGGLRNHQALGDFVLATAYQRADHVLDEVLPLDIPVIPNHRLNTVLLDSLDAANARYRLGVVHTTDNRNWEFNQGRTLAMMKSARSIAVDMESATIAANGFRYRIPNATLLCVSDKPLHAEPKLSDGARSFYEASKRHHLDIALAALDRVRREYPDGLPNQELRAADEPLLGADQTR
ncbi:AMP nucleosidase [Actinomadura sp. CNU-125]|uniref:phosphorylase family protein n=1 Tax=Actinomadura sp. CNU-125 TaxID=1904961 RepID=UPI00095CBA57|nr:AMP nucleosidase [Actinomadura sp. CNU-125]OLT32944.1 AMP nucleosidase [Actinomadura sp. CNU-125]